MGASSRGASARAGGSSGSSGSSGGGGSSRAGSAGADGSSRSGGTSLSDTLVVWGVVVASRRRGGLLRKRTALALGAPALAFEARGLAVGSAALATVVAASEQGHQPVTSRAWRTSQSSRSTAAARESSLVRGGWGPNSRAAMAVVKRSS
jgi:hypothetical protein